jgi:hypothetical protein
MKLQFTSFALGILLPTFCGSTGLKRPLRAERIPPKFHVEVMHGQPPTEVIESISRINQHVDWSRVNQHIISNLMSIGIIYVAQVRGDIIAYAVTTPPKVNAYFDARAYLDGRTNKTFTNIRYLAALAVDPDFWRYGIGRSLLLEVAHHEATSSPRVDGLTLRSRKDTQAYDFYKNRQLHQNIPLFSEIHIRPVSNQPPRAIFTFDLRRLASGSD